ncbi:hypothetical protein LguiA_017837 [Lonicera macranthoides]
MDIFWLHGSEVDTREDNHTHAFIPKYLTPKFSHLLKEGKAYSITTFKVVESKESYRTVSHQFKIIFLPTTSIKEEEGDFPEIKMHRFEFLNLTNVHNRLNNDSQLIDVMGEVTVVGAVEDQAVKRTIVQKKVIEIEGKQSSRLQITLCAEKATQIDENLISDNSKRLTAIVISTTIRMFREFMQMYDGNVIRKINAASEPIKQMTIAEILSLHSDSDSEGLMEELSSSNLAIPKKHHI